MRFIQETALTFDDVLLVPNYSTCKSRLDPDVSTTLLGRELDIPIISSNMDTVTELNMASAMYTLGGIGIFHRFHKNDNKHKEELKTYSTVFEQPIISVGIDDQWLDYILDLRQSNLKPSICVDVAHADNKNVHDFIKKLKNNHPDLSLIVGNIATYDAASRLFDLGISTMKVGIGGGSVCSTRITTGFGVPTLTSIYEIRKNIDKSVHIIADGGIRNSGDIVKALAAGANSVMIGRLLAGSDESPGDKIYVNETLYKKYRGQSSHVFQKDHGIYRESIASEGEDILVPYTGPVKNTINQLVGGVKSGLSYCGAMNIEELQNYATFIRITQNGLTESKPHGKYNV